MGSSGEHSRQVVVGSFMGDKIIGAAVEGDDILGSWGFLGEVFDLECGFVEALLLLAAVVFVHNNEYEM
jgi:hypothetical protein